MIYLIGLLVFSPLVLWGLNRLKVRYVFAWFWTIFVCAGVWGGVLILLARGRLPLVFPLLSWGSGNDLRIVLDAVSGPFALALAGLGLAVVSTSAQRLADAQTASDNAQAGIPFENWRDQAAILALLGVGMFGAMAANPLTLLLAWAAGDLLGLWVLLVRISGREESERIVLDFSARVAGILLLIWAMVAARAAGGPLGFDAIPVETNVFLLLACGLRLGVLPLQVYFFEDLPLRRGVGMITRMAIPAVSSLVLLTRVGTVETPVPWAGILLLLTGIAGIYGGVYWFFAKSELAGRSYWVLGTGALALASAVRGEARAVLAWGLALLLVGGGLFLFSARGRWVRGIVVLGGVMFSALPGMPISGGMGLFSENISGLVLPFMLVHGFLLAGFARHVRREGEMGQAAVRAIRGVYALGLFIPQVTLLLAGWRGETMRLPGAWWASAVGIGIAVVLEVWHERREISLGRTIRGEEIVLGAVARRVFSFHWLYRLFWRAYRLAGGGVAFISVLLEGEAGILWTLLLLFLLISLITTQVVSGG